MRKTTLVLSLLAMTSLAWPQLWKKTKVEVKAGQGVGPITLGESLSKVSDSYLGKASQHQKATQAPGSGYALFGSGDSRDVRKGILVFLGDGKPNDRVYSLQVKGIRAATKEGVYLEGPASAILKSYRDAQMDINPFSRQPEYCIPGLTIRTRSGKVEEFLVEPKDRQRWRFAQLKVIPGQSVGPIEVGKAVPLEAFDLLGPPTVEVAPGRTQNSGLLRWAIAGQNPKRMIEVTLHNGRSAKAVVSVRLRGVKAETNQRIKLGDKAAAVQDLYPDGREGLHDQPGAVTWRVPGASFVLQDGLLNEILIYDLGPKKTRP